MSAAGGAQTIRADELAAASGRVAVDAARRAEPVAPPAAPAEWSAKDDDIPPLPQKLTGAQAARLAEVFDHMHRGLTQACESIDANEEGTEVRLGFAEWQTVQAVQMLLARYGRLVAEPDTV
jgi:hypothetical protein